MGRNEMAMFGGLVLAAILVIVALYFIFDNPAAVAPP